MTTNQLNYLEKLLLKHLRSYNKLLLLNLGRFTTRLRSKMLKI